MRPLRRCKPTNGEPGAKIRLFGWLVHYGQPNWQLGRRSLKAALCTRRFRRNSKERIEVGRAKKIGVLRVLARPDRGVRFGVAARKLRATALVQETAGVEAEKS